MRILRLLLVACVLLGASWISSARCWAQAGAASIEFTAHARPLEGQAEPVRGMTFYLLSRSLSDIRSEVESTNALVDFDHFVAQLDLSPEMKAWMRKHRRVDLAGEGFTKELTADDIIDVPEFLAAYKLQNGAALHAVLPEPKYKSGDEEKNAEKYKLQKEQYRQALRRYVQANLDSLQGLDADLREINPNLRWTQLQSEQRRHLEQRAMQLAQTRYLVAMAVTNLNGKAVFENLAPGQYWISNLDVAALAGDLRLHWDVAIAVARAKTAHLELSDLNAVETSEQTAR
jgi:hypothetical protein